MVVAVRELDLGKRLKTIRLERWFSYFALRGEKKRGNLSSDPRFIVARRMYIVCRADRGKKNSARREASFILAELHGASEQS